MDFFLKEKIYNGYESKFETLYQLPPRQALQPRLDLIEALEYLSSIKNPEEENIIPTGKPVEVPNGSKKKNNKPLTSRNVNFVISEDHKFVRHNIFVDNDDNSIELNKKDLWTSVNNIKEDTGLYQEFWTKFMEDFDSDHSCPFQCVKTQKSQSSRNKESEIELYPNLNKLGKELETMETWINEQRENWKKITKNREDNQ